MPPQKRPKYTENAQESVLKILSGFSRKTLAIRQESMEREVVLTSVYLSKQKLANR